MAKIRRYSELVQFETFEDRFDYLMLGGQVGESTFGFDRWINQAFYVSQEWKIIRREVILRDRGCDLGVEGHEIHNGLFVHHMNPMTTNDVSHGEEWILNPEFLIVVSLDTHNAIHYGDKSKLKKPYVPRAPGDTKLW